jgi:hypothetical protein
MFTSLKTNFEATNKADNWFVSYHQELGLVSNYLFNTLPWAEEILKLIEAADLNKISTNLPITLSENEYYRDKVVRRRKASDPNSIPRFYTHDVIERFAEQTSSKYIKWIQDHT